MLVLMPDALFEDDAEIEREVLGDFADVLVHHELIPERIPGEDWRRADALIVYYGVPVDRQLVERLDGCRMLVRAGVGYDHIDIAACAERGIPVCNVPDYGTTEVADHAIALTLALARGLVSYHARLLALVRRAAGAPAARRHIRDRRAGPDRHRGEPPGQRPGHGGLLLRSLPARWHGARSRLPAVRQPGGPARRVRRGQPALPADRRQSQHDRRDRPQSDQAGRIPDQHGTGRSGRPQRARGGTARRPAGRRGTRRAAGGAAGPRASPRPGIQAPRAGARRASPADPARRLV